MTYNRIIQGQTGRKRKEGRREKKKLFRSFLKKKKKKKDNFRWSGWGHFQVAADNW